MGRSDRGSAKGTKPEELKPQTDVATDPHLALVKRKSFNSKNRSQHDVFAQ